MAASESSLTSAVMVPHILTSRRLASEILFHKFSLNEDDKPRSLASIISGTHIDSSLISQLQLVKLTSKVNKLIKVKLKPVSQLSISLQKHLMQNFQKDIVDATIQQCIVMINEFRYKELVGKKIYIEKRLLEIGNDLTSSEESLKVV